MENILTPQGRRRHRSATTQVKQRLRDLRSQLGMLNQRVGSRVALRNVDLDCLDVIGSCGPLSPSELARLTGIHPATLTGVLDRLERGGWIARRRGPGDRRTVRLHSLPDRNRELFGHYSGMSRAMDRICADYTTEQLELVVEFLRRTTEAGVVATEELSPP